MTTDSFVVKPIRFPGGSIGELAVNGTVNDLAVSGARPLALSALADPRGGARRRRAAGRGRGDRGRAPRRPASRSSPATRRSSSAATRDSMYVCTTGIGALDAARRARHRRDRARRPGARLRLGRRARHGDHAGPRRVRAGRRDRVRHPLAVARASTRCWRPPGPALRCMRDATRGGIASVLNELARASRRRDRGARGRRAGAPRGRRRRRAARDRPDVRRQRGRARRLRRPRARREAALAALRSVPGCEAAAEIGEVNREPPGMVLVETAFGGTRVMDLLAGDPLPRIC